MSPLKAEFSLTSGERKSKKYSLAGLGESKHLKKKKESKHRCCVLTLGAKTCEMWPLGIKSSSLLIVRKWESQSSDCRVWILLITWMGWEEDPKLYMRKQPSWHLDFSPAWPWAESPATLYPDFWFTELGANKFVFFLGHSVCGNLLWNSRKLLQG